MPPVAQEAALRGAVSMRLCKVTPAILHGVVSPELTTCDKMPPVAQEESLRGVVSMVEIDP